MAPWRFMLLLTCALAYKRPASFGKRCPQPEEVLFVPKPPAQPRAPRCQDTSFDRGGIAGLEKTDAPTTSTTTVTTTATTTTTTRARHFLLPFGDGDCPEGLHVDQEVECFDAALELKVPHAPAGLLNDTTLPPGCLVRLGDCSGPDDFCLAFNAAPVGLPLSRMDITPLCRSFLPGQKYFSAEVEHKCCGTSTTRPVKYVRFTTVPYKYEWTTSTKRIKPVFTTTTTTTTSVTTTTTVTTVTTSTSTTTTEEFNETEWNTTTSTQTTTTSQTTTSSTTATTTTITTTTTETTSTSSSSTSSTTTTSTTTSTTTTTSSTSTTATTHTTRTTYFGEGVLVPCAPLCSRYPVGLACRNPLEPGESCEAKAIGGPCITETELTISCPEDNEDVLRQPDVTGEIDGWIKCFVCSLEVETPKDNDWRAGFVSIMVSFGANSQEGNITEVGISHYAVFLADEGGQRLPGLEPVKNVSLQETVKEPLRSDCCQADTYSNVIVKAELPENVTTVRLEVVPVLDDNSEFLPAGLLTDFVVDWEDVAFFRAGAAAARPRAAPGPLSVLLPLLFHVLWAFATTRSQQQR